MASNREENQVVANTPGNIVTVQREAFSGPLPPPVILKQYSDAVPNGGERVVAMAEREAAHRHACEIKMLENEADGIRSGYRESYRGQNCAVIVAVSALIATCICAIIGQTAVACTLAGTTVVAAIGAFVAGRRASYAQQQQQQPSQPTQVIVADAAPAKAKKK